MLDGTNKRPEIIQIIQIVKIVSMLFPAIAYFQYFFSINDPNYTLNYAISMTPALLAIVAVYLCGELLKTKIKNVFVRTWIDPIIALSLALTSVMLTGAYASSYKFLFILVIISSSIECTLRTSLTISGISSVIILGIDLILAPTGAVNPYFESDIVLACVFMIISWTIGFYVNLGNKHIKDLNNIANTDGLTGLFNHRFFYDCLLEQIGRSKREGFDLSLLFIDIDDFKYYNDVYGHQKGDEILRRISAIMRETVRNNTFIARYGGEEFAILLPGVKEELAVKIAERLRHAVQEYPFEGQENMPGGTLTISVGVSSFPARAKTDTELVKGADEACYRAKFLRKNRVEAYYSILEELQEDVDEPAKEIITSIKTLIAVINAKDKYTYGHVERVVYYCNLIAEKLKLDDTDKKNFVYAAYLHDIGKINIPEEILMKSKGLTQEEWEALKNHPKYAAEIIKNVHSLSGVVPIILQHHERYDGTGYPKKLKGDEIHYLASILTVIDSFDAMTSLRPYQEKKSYIKAIEELNRCSGTQFNPESVRIFVSTIEDIYDR